MTTSPEASSTPTPPPRIELTERFTWRGREVAWARSGSGPAVVASEVRRWLDRVGGGAPVA